MLFTGNNNAGKTSLLEAIFLLSSGGNPSGVSVGRYLRGLAEDTQKPAAVREIPVEADVFGIGYRRLH